MENAHILILDMARRQGLLRPRDVEACGVSRMTLSTLVRQGKLIRLCRGLYALPDRPVGEIGDRPRFPAIRCPKKTGK